MADNAKTYSDLMELLPEVAEIRIRWKLDESGLPGHVESFTLVGHGGAILADVDAEELEATESGPDRPITADLPLAERLPIVAMVLNWIEPDELEERDGVPTLELPSPDHVADIVPVTWGNSPTELQLSKSPRYTWVWAADRDQVSPVKDEESALDLDIGVVAMEGMECLVRAGYSFRWHPTVHPLDRAAELYGIPVAGGE